MSQHLSSAESPITRILFPEEGEVRMRRVTSRSQTKPTGKQFSWKVGRMVRWESEHEANAFKLLDADPSVRSYSEQPCLIEYMSDSQVRRHYPDLLVERDAGLELWEVKEDDEADETEVAQRTELMTAWLPRLGYRYRLLRASELAVEPALSNADQLRRLGRKPVAPLAREKLRRTLEKAGPLTWTQIRAAMGREEICGVSRLVLEGAIRVDLSTPMASWTIALPEAQGGV